MSNDNSRLWEIRKGNSRLWEKRKDNTGYVEMRKDNSRLCRDEQGQQPERWVIYLNTWKIFTCFFCFRNILGPLTWFWGPGTDWNPGGAIGPWLKGEPGKAENCGCGIPGPSLQDFLTVEIDWKYRNLWGFIEKFSLFLDPREVLMIWLLSTIPKDWSLLSVHVN